MKLQEFTENDITLKYAWQPSKVPSPHMVVVLTNCASVDGHVDLVFGLAGFKQTNKLYLASCAPYQYGHYLMKDRSYVLKDTVEALIEKHRAEANAEISNTYVIGYCAASMPTVIICLSRGYNGIFMEFSFFGGISVELDENDPVRIAFVERMYNAPNLHMAAASPQEFSRRVIAYTGRTDSYKITAEWFEALWKTNPEKLKAPKFYFYAGRGEESWVFFGRATCDALDKYGVNYQLTLSDEEYDHVSSIPYFTAFVKAKLAELGCR